MNEELLTEIIKRLDILIAINMSPKEDLESRIRILKSIGLPNTEIGKLTGMTEGNVRAKLKKGKAPGKKS